MMTRLQRLGDDIARKWCYVMHPDPMWPVRGKYQCPRCLRQYQVPWEEPRRPVAEPRRPRPIAQPVHLIDHIHA